MVNYLLQQRLSLQTLEPALASKWSRWSALGLNSRVSLSSTVSLSSSHRSRTIILFVYPLTYTDLFCSFHCHRSWVSYVVPCITWKVSLTSFNFYQTTPFFLFIFGLYRSERGSARFFSRSTVEPALDSAALKMGCSAVSDMVLFSLAKSCFDVFGQLRANEREYLCDILSYNIQCDHECNRLTSKDISPRDMFTIITAVK